MEKSLWLWWDQGKLEVHDRKDKLRKDKNKVIAGDFKIGFEAGVAQIITYPDKDFQEDKETLVVCIENNKHTLVNEYATVFVQLRNADFARDFLCILTKVRNLSKSCEQQHRL